MSSTTVPRYSRVSAKFWTDEKAAAWPDRVKLASLYLMTSPHRTLEGIFKLPPQYACADLRWTAKSWKSALTILQECGFLKWDSQTNVILLVNCLRYQAPENPNQVEAVLRRLRELPETPLLSEFCQLAQVHCTNKQATQAAQLFAQQLVKQLGQRLAEGSAPLNLLSVSLTQAKPLTESGKGRGSGGGEGNAVRGDGGNSEPERKGSGFGNGSGSGFGNGSTQFESDDMDHAVQRWPHLAQVD